MKRPIKKQRAFTLVELLVTIAITSILTTVVVVGYMNFLNKAAISTDEQLANQINRLILGYRVNNTIEEDDISEILIGAVDPNVEIQTLELNMNIYYNRDDKEFQVMDVEIGDSNKYKTLHEFLKPRENDPPKIEDNDNNTNNVIPDVEADINDTNDNNLEVKPEKKYNIREEIINNNYEVNVEISIKYDDNVIKIDSCVYNLNDLLSTLENVTYKINIISKVKCWGIENYEININSNGEVVFTFPGKFEVYITDGNYSDVIIINVINKNSEYTKAELKNTTGTYNDGYYSQNLDGTYNTFLPILYYFDISDYKDKNEMEEGKQTSCLADTFNKSFNDTPLTITGDNRLFVEVDGKEYNIESFMKGLGIRINNHTITEENYKIKIKYHYLGFNGIWVELEQTLQLIYNSSGDVNIILIK